MVRICLFNWISVNQNEEYVSIGEPCGSNTRALWRQETGHELEQFKFKKMLSYRAERVIYVCVNILLPLLLLLTLAYNYILLTKFFINFLIPLFAPPLIAYYFPTEKNGRPLDFGPVFIKLVVFVISFAIIIYFIGWPAVYVLLFEIIALLFHSQINGVALW